MEGFTEGTKAVVFLGERFVELTDAAITLQDVCEAFSLTYTSGIFVKDRATQRPVATLPFEVIVNTPSGSGAAAGSEKKSGEERESGDDAEKEEEEGGEDANGRSSGPALLDLITPADSSAAGATPGNNAHANTPVDVDAFASTTTGAGADGQTASVDLAMRELVKLGAVELLSADSAHRIAQLPTYNPRQTAPGLLRGMVYPSATYSPYRTKRDPLFAQLPPLEATPASGTRSAAAASAANQRIAQYQKDGPPYTSSLDIYGLNMMSAEDVSVRFGGEAKVEEEREEESEGNRRDSHAEATMAEVLKNRPDLVPLTDEQLAAFFH